MYIRPKLNPIFLTIFCKEENNTSRKLVQIAGEFYNKNQKIWAPAQTKLS